MRLVKVGTQYYYRKCELWRTSGHVNGNSAGTSLDYLIFNKLNRIESGTTKTVEVMKKIEDKKKDAIKLGVEKLQSPTEKLGTMNPAFYPYHQRYLNGGKVGQNGCYENDYENYVAALQERVCRQKEKDKEHDESSSNVSTPISVRLPCIASCISNHTMYSDY